MGMFHGTKSTLLILLEKELDVHSTSQRGRIVRMSMFVFFLPLTHASPGMKERFSLWVNLGMEMYVSSFFSSHFPY
jgi:hypothetical protein